MNGAAALTSVAVATAVPFPTTGNPNPSAPDSKITVPSTGIVQITDTGWYQVSWGIMVANLTTGGVVRPTLQISNAGGAFANAPFGPNYEGLDTSVVATNRGMLSETGVFFARSPCQIRIFNDGTLAIQVNNGSSSTTGGPCAYITLVKLNN
jgi:hypothetical protein